MQKQVEVRMAESHLEPVVETTESACSSFCDKIMKNMVLTLTILGKYRVQLLLYSHLCHAGFQCLSQHAVDKREAVSPSLHQPAQADKHIYMYIYGQFTLPACLWPVGET